MKSRTDKEKFYINWVLQQFKAMGADGQQIKEEKYKLTYEAGYLEYNLNFLNFSMDDYNEQEKHKKSTEC